MIGIIGGSGLDDSKLLKEAIEKKIETPYGKPSSAITIGKIDNIDVAILSRHGKDHKIMPSNVNFRANIWALKKLGVKHLIATTACGSLREEIMPGQLIFPTQFIDWTSKRASTFFDKEKVCHIPMADPFCPKIRDTIIEISKKLKIPHHEKGTVITIEGPRFSTRAESKMFRTIGADIINMSTVPEVVLAREAGMCYQSIAMATDYDCWREGESVDIASIMKVFAKNVENVKNLLLTAIPKISFTECECQKHIDNAIINKED